MLNIFWRNVAKLTKLKLLNEKNLLWFSIDLKWIQVYLSTHKIQEHFNGLGTKTTTSIEIHNLRVRSKAKYVFQNFIFVWVLVWHTEKKTNLKLWKESNVLSTNSFTSHSFFVIGVIVCHIPSSENESLFPEADQFQFIIMT